MELILGLLMVCAVPTLGLLVTNAVWRPRWAERVLRKTRVETVGEGAYRAGTHVVEEVVALRGGAPLSLKLAAWSSYFAGQMIVPGALAWAIGWLILIDGHNDQAVLTLGMLAFPPGVWAAVRVWRAGHAVMAGDRAAAAKAVSEAVSLTLWLNGVEVLASLILLLVHARDAEAAMVNLVYAPLSVAQVLFLRWAFLRNAARYPLSGAVEPEGPAPDGSVFVDQRERPSAA